MNVKFARAREALQNNDNWEKCLDDVLVDETEGGRNLVFYAAMYNHVDGLMFLIDSGCRVDYPDADGNTPLHIACIHDSVECASILMQSAADMSNCNLNGLTPLELVVVNTQSSFDFLSSLLLDFTSPISVAHLRVVERAAELSRMLGKMDTFEFLTEYISGVKVVTSDSENLNLPTIPPETITEILESKSRSELARSSEMLDDAVVAVWIGNHRDVESLDLYLEHQFSIDYGFIVDEGDEPEVTVKPEAVDIHDLFIGFSSWEHWLDSAVERCRSAGVTKASSAAVFYYLRFDEKCQLIRNRKDLMFVGNCDWDFHTKLADH